MSLIERWKEEVGQIEEDMVEVCKRTGKSEVELYADSCDYLFKWNRRRNLKIAIREEQDRRVI